LETYHFIGRRNQEGCGELFELKMKRCDDDERTPGPSRYIWINCGEEE